MFKDIEAYRKLRNESRDMEDSDNRNGLLYELSLEVSLRLQDSQVKKECYSMLVDELLEFSSFLETKLTKFGGFE